LQNDLEFFNSRVGALFEGFKDSDPSTMIYYVIFTIRKQISMLVLFFSDNGQFHLTINMVLSIAVSFIQTIFYIASTRCFKNPLDNLYWVLNESLLTVTHIVLMVQFIPYFHMSWDTTAAMVKYIFMTAGILNIGLNLGGIIYKQAQKLFEKRRTKILPELENGDKRYTNAKEIENHQKFNETNHDAIYVENLEE
jgi:hypothetical protein